MIDSSRLQIGEVSALTGILPGRIRHYEARGLIAPAHLDTGYRTFSVEDLLRLLQIDLLRSLGMGLEEIRASIGNQQRDLRGSLEWHRGALVQQRARLDELIAAVDLALADPESASATILERLTKAHRESLGVFGRLERPLSPEAAEAYDRLLGEWQLPVPSLVGQMLLPEPISDLLERLAYTPGYELLFERLRGLAERVLEVALSGDEQAAEELGRQWVAEQIADPPGEAVAEVLRQAAPRLTGLPVMRHGFIVWAESMSPLAARVLSTIAAEGQRRGVRVLGAIVVPPRGKRPGKRRSTSQGHRRASLWLQPGDQAGKDE